MTPPREPPVGSSAFTATPHCRLERSGERERADRLKGFLPKLQRQWYCGRAFVHWTLTIEHRAKGWLSPSFHAEWKLALVHTCARYRMAVPVYVLMPDHIHLLGTGLAAASDQRTAVEFLRKHTSGALAPARWQKQPHDHLLTEKERQRDAFGTVVNYIRENPRRAGLVQDAVAYPFTGCCVPGYPDLDVNTRDHMDLFWRIYYRFTRPASARV